MNVVESTVNRLVLRSYQPETAILMTLMGVMSILVAVLQPGAGPEADLAAKLSAIASRAIFFGIGALVLSFAFRMIELLKLYSFDRARNLLSIRCRYVLHRKTTIYYLSDIQAVSVTPIPNEDGDGPLSIALLLQSGRWIYLGDVTQNRDWEEYEGLAVQVKDFLDVPLE